jgi:hypothetical protein
MSELSQKNQGYSGISQPFWKSLLFLNSGLIQKSPNSSGIYFYSGMTRIIMQQGLQPIPSKNPDPSMIRYELAERFSGLVDK